MQRCGLVNKMRLYFPATQRNRDPILEVLRPRMSHSASVLEIACGSGEHAAYFAAQLPLVRWLPTDPDPAHITSTDAWQKHENLPNLRPAQLLDVCKGPWPDETFDAIFCANMIHIAPWEAAIALLGKASAHLKPEGRLFLYGPFKLDGVHTAPSNEAFDASLRARDPRWGVRDRADVVRAAKGLQLTECVAMPSNNFSLVFQHA